MSAQDYRSETLLGIGMTQHLDTYLSPQHYNGPELRVLTASYIYGHDGRHQKNWYTLLQHEGSMAMTEPKSENASELSGSYRFAAGRLRTFVAQPHFRLSAGLLGELGVGFDYITRNTNNPAQARLSAAVVPALRLSYGFRLWQKTLVAGYNAQVPLVGVMFSPQYGQSYYEIFSRGNYDHNAVLTSAFAAPSLSHRLTLSIPFSRSSLTVGYLGDWRQAVPNDLKQHQYTHSIVIGWSR